MLGEPLLRLRARRPLSKVTVPLLLADGAAIGDSLAIARWADGRGDGAPLFPAEHEAAIARFNRLSERILAAGRALVTPRVCASEAARLEAVPSPLRPLGRVAGAMAAQGARFIMRKYQTEAASCGTHRERLRDGLVELRTALDGRQHLLDERITYADITLAVTLQCVRPVADAFLALGPATREAWTDPELATSFADLVAWRDGLYQRFR